MNDDNFSGEYLSYLLDDLLFLGDGQLLIKLGVQRRLLEGLVREEKLTELFEMDGPLPHEVLAHHLQFVEQFVVLLDKLRYHPVLLCDVLRVVESEDRFLLDEDVFFKFPFKGVEYLHDGDQFHADALFDVMKHFHNFPVISNHEIGKYRGFHKTSTRFL